MVHLLKMVIFHGYVSHNQMVTIPLRPCDNAFCVFLHICLGELFGFLTKKTLVTTGGPAAHLARKSRGRFLFVSANASCRKRDPSDPSESKPKLPAMPSHGISLTSWLHRMPKALDSLDALVCNKLNPSCSEASDVASVRLLPGKDVFDMPCRTCSANGQRILQRICKWDINGLVGS